MKDEDKIVKVQYLPPGYAYGYIPQGEIEEVFEDTRLIIEAVNVENAFRKNQKIAKKLSNKMAIRSFWAGQPNN